MLLVNHFQKKVSKVVGVLLLWVCCGFDHWRRKKTPNFKAANLSFLGWPTPYWMHPEVSNLESEWLQKLEVLFFMGSRWDKNKTWFRFGQQFHFHVLSLKDKTFSSYVFSMVVELNHLGDVCQERHFVVCLLGNALFGFLVVPCGATTTGNTWMGYNWWVRVFWFLQWGQDQLRKCLSSTFSSYSVYVHILCPFK